jgi:CheY-like chemotaxis protein
MNFMQKSRAEREATMEVARQIRRIIAFKRLKIDETYEIHGAFDAIFIECAERIGRRGLKGTFLPFAKVSHGPSNNSSQNEKRRVLVADDSGMVRQAMRAILWKAPRLEVSVAPDALIVLRKIRQQRPDGVVTDLEMPRMDGLTFRRTLMQQSPIPVVVCSGLATCGVDLALRALEEDALAIIAKPKLGVRELLPRLRSDAARHGLERRAKHSFGPG